MFAKGGMSEIAAVAGRLSVVALLSPLVASCGGIGIRQFLAFEAPVVALTQVRVIDGSGRPARENQTVIIQSDRIAAVGASGSVAIPAGARVLDLPGRAVLPGFVGMHDHLFYQMGSQAGVRAQESFAMLYLASGVTTIRTAGTVRFGRRPPPQATGRRRPAAGTDHPCVIAVSERGRCRSGSAALRPAGRGLGRRGCHLIQGVYVASA